MSQAMNMTKRTGWAGIFAALAAASLMGCAGDPAVTGEGSPLLGPDALPLPMAATDMLDMAPDCAGRLGDVSASNYRFEVASLSAGLVAVVDAAGGVVCVDTVSDVQSDLDASGQSAEADTLVAGFQAAAHEADGRDARFAGRALPGDPEPQPNDRPGAIPDPEPQPN